MVQRYLWQQADGKRHAYDTEHHHPAAARALPVLCGATVTPKADDMVGVWLDPTCWQCDREIRIRLDFPANEIPDAPGQTDTQ
ncbi:zinc finger protein [Saccharomonospora viridis]|jgi:hypothetical protein|uniref:Zinc-finger n=3 Tax=Saccharomonospora viridis TaxID=1852 RepID=C7MQE3_SACVD|nr:hypothetical protein Svir_14000 [Saccharomonospora viridis DSM 43017]KHF42578.1 hypothetical protein MINT15_27800 [Saccharomonospora viridis]